MPRRMLCVHFPHLSADRARRDDLELAATAEQARPLVLTRRAGAAVIVERVCPRAQQRGVRSGMTLAQAQALAPNLCARPSAAHRDAALMRRLTHWALRFSPVVEVFTSDALLLDITGCAHLFGGEAPLARQVVGGLAQQGLHAKAAVADTPGAAYALATAGTDAIIVVPVGQTCAYLAPLPPSALRIEPHAVERLDMLGVRTIGDLLMLPRSTLPARFGAQLVRRLRQALGEAPEPLTPSEDEPLPVAQTAFETPVRDGQTIRFVLQRLLNDLYAQLERRDLALRGLQCVMTCEDRAPAVQTISLSHASRSWRHVSSLAVERVAQLDPTPGVCGLRLIACETTRWRGVQNHLFSSASPRSDEEIGCLVDRLINRLGEAAVVRAELVDDHQPERAFQYVPVAQGRLDARGAADADAPTRRPDQPPPGSSAQPRPLRLLPRPAPLKVIALLPDGPPTWVATANREYPIASACGPERIETGWWRGPDVQRDYFRLTTEHGGQLWVFRDCRSGRWYLHGVFG
ncbi:MAG: DNA polymerase Y family protein [Planctomycetota bacterium]|nr:MAG: DNA polymerase Y family protein [Planctomycetota bacterium]